MAVDVTVDTLEGEFNKLARFLGSEVQLELLSPQRASSVRGKRGASCG